MLDCDQSCAFQKNTKLEKRHDLQGPIDDAFGAPFLRVKGTGTPWSPAVQTRADARLNQFAKVCLNQSSRSGRNRGAATFRSSATWRSLSGTSKPAN